MSVTAELSRAAALPPTGELLTGIFAGPVAGLRYESPTVSGETNAVGEFRYRAGEKVAFRIGRLTLGATEGAAWVNLAQLVPRVAGSIEKLRDPGITNLARFLLALDRTGRVEGGVSIAPGVHEIVGSRVIDFDQLFRAGVTGDSFASDPQVVAVLEALNADPDVFSTPRSLVPAVTARNELRRNIRGILKLTDVEIPLRDGSVVYADVFRPAEPGSYPVIMNKGFYGKAFHQDCICNEADALEKEEAEDRYFSGNPDGLQYENHESVNSAEWVPNGYVTVRVDSRGVGRSSGRQAPLGRQEAEDYYDAIEWAGQQSWSNGNVGLWGMSYYAMSQHNVASLAPPHLKAMIAIATDSDPYNEYLYGGGLFSEGFWTWWWKVLSRNNSCGERRETDWMADALAHPFDDPEVYGPDAQAFMKPDLEKATAPVWIVSPQTGAVLHQLGSSETYRNSIGAKARRLDFIDAWFPYSYRESTVAEHMRYFDHWLKGVDNGVMDRQPVLIEVRTGNASSYELREQEWPIARTEYFRYHLDATPSDWTGDEHGSEVFRLTPAGPLGASAAGYEAHLDLGKPIPAPIQWAGGTPRWSTGISFVSDPMETDSVLVGYMKAVLWVASSSHDMDVHVSLRVFDDQDREIRYEAAVLPNDPNHVFPVGYGQLKVSHRALDHGRSTEYWPVHTHAEADHAPLAADEIVEIQLGLNPSSALIRKGSRLRVDIQPFSPAGVPPRAYDETYHVGAINTVYTGPDHPSYIQLPLLPAADSHMET